MTQPSPQALHTSALTSLPLLARGKVRDNYAVGDDRILMVASDRLSAFDVIMGEPIPGKGELLTQMALFWFDKLGHICPNHLTGEAPESVVSPAEAAQVQLSGTEQDLIVRLSQAYFDVLAAEDSLSFVRALKTAVTEQLESAKRNFEVGNATITDSREAEARFDLATAQEIAAENDLRVKRLALDQLVGLVGIQPQPLAQPIVLPQAQPQDVNTWVDWAVNQHPAVVQSRMALDIARLETAKARTGHQPTVDLQASVGRSRYPDGNPSVSAAPNASYRGTNAGIGVVLNWPLFAGFAIENRVRETVSLEERARADLDNIQRTVAQATRAAFFGVQSGHGQVAALEAAERSSLTSLEANQLGYQVGVRINIDVLNAQSQLFQTRRDLAQARYVYLVSRLRLLSLAGEDRQASVAQVNAWLKP